MQRELTKREKNLLSTMTLTDRQKADVESVWKNKEQTSHREYANALLFLIPFFIIFFLAAGTDSVYREFRGFMAGICWILYFALPTYMMIKLCFSIINTTDRNIRLSFQAMYIWRKPVPVKRAYNIAISFILIIILAVYGFRITAACITMSFIVISFCVNAVRIHVQRELDAVQAQETSSTPAER